MKKGCVAVILVLAVLIAGIFAINAAVDKTKQWHPADTNIKILVDGSEKTLQQAINENLLTGSHNYSIPSSVSAGGHSTDEIWVSINGVENDLLNTLKTTGLYGNKTTISYTGPADKSKAYHYATEIEVTINGSAMSLQNAVDTSKICYTYSWKNSSWETCSAPCATGTQTRSVWCERSDGVIVNDNYCSDTKPATNQGCNTQVCAGTGCYTCPWGSSSGHCNLNGRQGRWKSPYKSEWSSWSYYENAARCYEKIICSGNCNWEIKL